MEYVRLGQTGLKVSRICLGCMSFGRSEVGSHPWTLGEAQARPIVQRALDLGVNFFDTANVYSLGTSEEIVGKLLREMAPREQVVIATKVHGRMSDDPNGAGLSRRAIFQEIDASLRRLGVDYVDLYQIHRWDSETPIEETLEALHDVVKSGKVRYIGASSMRAWQFAKALYLADLHGWTRFVSMQNHLNLMYREEEREMLPLCEAEGVAVLPWSPLARGKLTRNWQEPSNRSQSDDYGKLLYGKTEASDFRVWERVSEIAAKRKISRAQVALAWVSSKPMVTSPIMGATQIHHLEEAVASLDVRLAPDEIQRLEEAYEPHPVVGHS